MGRQKLTTEDFIKKAREVHGDRYDYSLVDYKTTHARITIICPDHGPFEQRGSNHLSGYNCKKCGKIGKASNKRLSTELFIERAKKIHGHKYDYSKVDYRGAKFNVTIICPEHGEFEQRASVHLSGHGCNDCALVKNSPDAVVKTHMLVKKISFGGRILEHINLNDDEYMTISSKSPNSRTIGVFNG